LKKIDHAGIKFINPEQNFHQFRSIHPNIFFQDFVVKMWSNQENRVRKQVKNPCEVVAYAMHSSGKTSLAVGLSPYTFP